MYMYNTIANKLFSIIAFCHFILGVLWHYHWYCGERLKELNPETYQHHKKKKFFTVIKEQWNNRYGWDGD